MSRKNVLGDFFFFSFFLCAATPINALMFQNKRRARAHSNLFPQHDCAASLHRKINQKSNQSQKKKRVVLSFHVCMCSFQHNACLGRIAHSACQLGQSSFYCGCVSGGWEETSEKKNICKTSCLKLHQNLERLVRDVASLGDVSTLFTDPTNRQLAEQTERKCVCVCVCVCVWQNVNIMNRKIQRGGKKKNMSANQSEQLLE